MPFLRLIPTAMQVCYVLNFIQMVIRGLFAVYWYKKKANAAFTAFMTAAPKARNAAMPCRNRRHQLGSVFIYLGVYIAAGVLGSFLMGPDLNAVIRFFDDVKI